MPTPEDLFSETFRRFWKKWTFITSLRQVADVAIPIAEEALSAIHTDFIEHAAVDPQYRKMIVNLDGTQTDWDEELKKLFRAGMTDTAITNARAAVDAASLIFAQSVLDDCAWSYLRVCSLVNPADWEPFIGERKVAFNTLGRTPEVIRYELIEEKLEQLERESLMKKVDLLFQICPPPDKFAPINSYYL